MVEVHGEEVGEDGPAGGAEEGAGDLVTEFLVDAGQVGVEGHEGHNQDGHGGYGAEADDEGNDFPNQRKQPVNQPLQRASQHQENQAAHAGEDKDNGVSRADNPPHNIIPLSGNLIYPVQTPLNAQHPPGGRPQRRDGRNGHNRSRRFCIQIIDNPHHKGIQHIRHDSHRDGHQIRFADVGNKLNQGQKQHDKWKK